MKIAVFSAFPQELKHLRKLAHGSNPEGDLFPISIACYRETELIMVETGMSIPNMAAAFTHVASEYGPDIILSLGFGGALYYRADIGDLVLASRYFLYTREGAIELEHLARRSAELQRSLWNGSITTRLRRKIPIKDGSFITLPQRIAKTRLKSSLPGAAPFPVCDQETVYLARLACLYDLPFFAIRAITDRADEDIPEDLFSVVDEKGRYRRSLALGILLSRPSLLPDGVRLGLHAARASRNLGAAVRAFVEVVGSSHMAMARALHPSARRPGVRTGSPGEMRP